MRGKIIFDDGQQANFALINREVSIERALGPRLDPDIIAHLQGSGIAVIDEVTYGRDVIGVNQESGPLAAIVGMVC